MPEDLSIKRRRFTGSLKGELDAHAEDPAIQFDSDFTFMTLELSKFIEKVIKAFGGASEIDSI